MATTATLEDNYQVRPVSVDQRPGMTLYVRTFRVPAYALDSLKPSIGDTFSTDSAQRVVAATPSRQKGALAAFLVVTYKKLVASGSGI